jgi:hypothetical protein
VTGFAVMARTVYEGTMRSLFALLVLIAILFGVSAADARGGRTDDCPQGSTDPDCAPPPPAPGK